MDRNARDAAGRRIILNVDLNHPPPGDIMDQNDAPEVGEGQGSRDARGQAVSDVAVTSDDDVEIISPRRSAEATRNSRRRINRATTKVPLVEDSSLKSELQPVNPNFNWEWQQFTNPGGSPLNIELQPANSNFNWDWEHFWDTGGSSLKNELQPANSNFYWDGEHFLNFGGSNGTQNIGTDAGVPMPPPVVRESSPTPGPSRHTFLCAICGDTVVEATSTKCGFIFCNTCILKQ